jgi:hypothetical protein
MGVGKSTMDKWVRQLRAERNGISPQVTPMTPDHRFQRWAIAILPMPGNRLRNTLWVITAKQDHINIIVAYVQMQPKGSIGLATKPWPVLLDHYN